MQRSKIFGRGGWSFTDKYDYSNRIFIEIHLSMLLSFSKKRQKTESLSTEDLDFRSETKNAADFLVGQS